MLTFSPLAKNPINDFFYNSPFKKYGLYREGRDVTPVLNPISWT